MCKFVCMYGFAGVQFLHESIYQNVLDKLVGLYKQVKIGNPLEKGTLVGPLHTHISKENFEKGIAAIKSQACFASLGEFLYTKIHGGKKDKKGLS